MINNISFIKATENDIPEIIRLAELAWKPTYANINSDEQNQFMFNTWYSYNGLKQQMNEGQIFWLMRETNMYIGYASYSTITNYIYKLNKLYIIPNFKNRGLGKLFLLFIEENAKKTDKKTIHLNVNRNNKAILFYQKCGYNIIKNEDVAFGNYWMNDFVMGKNLI